MKIGKVSKSKRSRRTRAYVVYLKLDNRNQLSDAYTQQIGVRFNGGFGSWLCVCCTHAESRKFETSREADEASRNPEVFCFRCNDYTSGRGLILGEVGRA